MPRMMFTGLPARFASRIKSAEYDVLLGSPDRPVFRQDGITAPATWSRTAVTVMAQKYFRKAGVPSATRPVYEIEVPTWLQRREPEPGCTFGGETSTAQVHGRLAGGWTYWGWKGGYFEDEGSAKDFHAACLRLLDHQAFAPNSPQYFNMGLFWAYGIAGRPQGQFYVDPASGEVVASTSEYERVSVSACFINTVEDTLVGHDGITDMVTKEARIFRSGAGSGANFSRLRGEGEPLSNGGKSSGMMSFLKVFDTAAGAIKSGGTTRRAAKMAVLDLDHPDVETFIDWKVHEEAKVAAMAAGSALVKAQVALVTAALAAEAAGGPGGAVAAAVATARGLGVPDGVLVRVVELHGEGVAPAVIEYGVDWQSEAYATVSGQNANNSVRVPDAFMHAVEADGDWPLYWRTELTAAAAEGRTPVPCKVLKAKDLWHKVAAAAWACADPGVQFSDTINAWHTSPKGGEIRASNPCQPGFATVLTPEGIRTFDDISEGSTIWSGDTWTTVVRKTATGVKPVSRYHTRAGTFVGTKEHLVFESGSRVEVGQAETIDVCNGPRQPVAEDTLPFLSQAVVDGWAFGDGYLKVANGGKSKYPLLCVGENDQWVLTDSRFTPFVEATPFDALAHRVHVTQPIADAMGRKVWEREIPPEYVGADPLVVAAFLRGLYAANGSVCGKRVTLKATCLETIIQAQQMLSALGIPSYYTVNKPSTIKWPDGKEYTSRQSYDLNITAGRWDFHNLIGFLHDSKKKALAVACQASPRNWSKTTFNVTSVEDLGEQPVWDIEVACAAHSYWTGGLLVSNCSEYLYIDDTSCNLASLNLGKFLDGREFDVDAFHYVTRLVTTILDISVTAGQFPTESIARKTYDYRPIGIGYANLGAMLMRLGLPYDSDSGRWVAAAVTALMQGVALATSAELSDVVGAFPGYADNHRAHQRVVENHATAAHELVGIYGTYHDLSTTPTVPPVARDLPSFITVAWRAAHEMRRAVDRVGYRNGHLSVLAPTGTISLTMDCQTTGVEPGFSLVSYKSLAGGGSLKLVNAAVGDALRNLGYTPDRVAEILAHVEKTDTIEGCEHLTLDHLAVFDCAVPPASGRRAVSVDGHIKMLAAVQPFLSGAASKTINCPSDSTIDDIAGVLFRSWRLMVKAVAVYRDGSKLSQPVTTKLPAVAPPPEPKKAEAAWSVEVTMRQICDEARGLVVGDPFGVTVAASQPVGDGTSLADVAVGPVIAPPQPSPRRPLPSRRTGYTQKARIGGQKLYLKTGEYEDGTIGELFLTFNKTGTALQGMANAFAVAVSLGLQHGVPLEEFVDAFAFTRFEPSGVVQGDDRIKMASSVVDYVFRELGVTYLRRADLATVPPPAADPQLPPPVVPLVVVVTDDNEADLPASPSPVDFQKLTDRLPIAYDGTPCAVCGAFAMTRSGTCKTCQVCGSNTGCG